VPLIHDMVGIPETLSVFAGQGVGWKQTDFKDLDFVVADGGGNTIPLWSSLAFVPFFISPYVLQLIPWEKNIDIIITYM
jgi:hypothetical protein